MHTSVTSFVTELHSSDPVCSHIHGHGRKREDGSWEFQSDGHHWVSARDKRWLGSRGEEAAEVERRLVRFSPFWQQQPDNVAVILPMEKKSLLSLAAFSLSLVCQRCGVLQWAADHAAIPLSLLRFWTASCFMFLVQGLPPV